MPGDAVAKRWKTSDFSDFDRAVGYWTELRTYDAWAAEAEACTAIGYDDWVAVFNASRTMGRERLDAMADADAEAMRACWDLHQIGKAWRTTIGQFMRYQSPPVNWRNDGAEKQSRLEAICNEERASGRLAIMKPWCDQTPDWLTPRQHDQLDKELATHCRILADGKNPCPPEMWTAQ